MEAEEKQWTNQRGPIFHIEITYARRAFIYFAQYNSNWLRLVTPVIS